MSSVVRVVLAGVIAVGLVPGGASAAPGDWALPDGGWAQDGYGPGNTGVNPNEHTITTRNAGKLRYRWSVLSAVTRSGCLAQSAPVVAGRRLFLPDANGFAAYDAVTGQRLWRRNVGIYDSETPKFAVSGNLLLSASNTCGSVSDPDVDLAAYDVATGAKRWSVKRDAPMAHMVVDRNVVAVGGGDAGEDRVSVYRRSDGTLLWSAAELELAADVSADGRLLLARTGEKKGSMAVDIVTGKELWSTKARWTVAAADPAGERFIVGDATGKLHALDARNGNTVWSAGGIAREDGTATIAVDDTRIYATHDTHLIALDAKTGKKIWDQEFLSNPLGQPTVAGGVVYAPIEDGWLAIRDARTGDDLDDLPLVGDVHGHAVVTGGHLYVTNGRVLDVFTP
ncbi:outer membrane protein assembly factor BamB family protein [Virgisporangium aurantiacum]|uniref:outer membrane protein assembly factor BamB family protein n=1 Tax=Virgisporangium aurantiacum TaxID=175570 RepID=UPI0019502D66|nr:PQQ-binding-like beta-propeller repeat protein [Virgisporangium aurantiacum]